MKLITILMASLLTACVTETQYTAKKIEPEFTKISAKGRVGDKVMGLNEKKEIVLREERDIADELRVQQMVNIRLRDDLGYEAHRLKECRLTLSDPDLGGNGKMPEVYDIEKLKGAVKAKETMGLDSEEDLKIVKETYLLDELKTERKYTDSLKSTIEIIIKHKEECEFKLVLAKKKRAKLDARAEVDYED